MIDNHTGITTTYTQDELLTTEELKHCLLKSSIKELNAILAQTNINKVVREKLTNISLALHIANGGVDIPELIDDIARD